MIVFAQCREAYQTFDFVSLILYFCFVQVDPLMGILLLFYATAFCTIETVRSVRPWGAPSVHFADPLCAWPLRPFTSK